MQTVAVICMLEIFSQAIRIFVPLRIENEINLKEEQPKEERW